jgi:hypothetical protein
LHRSGNAPKQGLTFAEITHGFGEFNSSILSEAYKTGLLSRSDIGKGSGSGSGFRYNFKSTLTLRQQDSSPVAAGRPRKRSDGSVAPYYVLFEVELRVAVKFVY